MLESAAVVLLIFSSCGSKKINPDDYVFITDFNEKGYAMVADFEGNYVAINSHNEIVSPTYQSIAFAGEDWYVAADEHGNYLLDGSFQAVDTAMCYYSDVNKSGIIWAGDRDGHVRATDARTGRTLLEEDNVEFMDMNPSGLAVLRRCGAHKISTYRHFHPKDVYDYMLVRADGSIKAPWGRYKYVEPFSNGRAKFTNEATFYKVKEGLFPADEFEPVVRYGRQRYGYLDENGDVAIPERYELCDAFDENGHARADVTQGDSKPNIIIDIYGNVVREYRPDHSALY